MRSAAFTSPNQHQKVEDGFTQIAPDLRNDCRFCVDDGGAAGDIGGEDDTGQHHHGPLHTDTNVALEEGLTDKGGAFSCKGGKGNRGEGSIHIEFEKPAIDRENHNKGQYRYKETAQQRDQPQRNALQKAQAIDGIYHFRWHSNGCSIGTADAARCGRYNAVANRKDFCQKIHSVSNGHLRQHKLDQVAHHIFRSLEVPEAGGAAKEADGKEQHQQTVANGLHPAVDGDDGAPDGAALEGFRRLGQQAPHFLHFGVPCGKKRFCRLSTTQLLSKLIHLHVVENCGWSIVIEKIVMVVPVDFFVSPAYNRSRENPTFHTFRRVVQTMLAKAFVDNAKVMAKGQVTIPKDVRDVLGVASGDRVTFVVEGNTVRIVNSAVYAMQMLQQEMAGEAERTGLTSDDDVMALVKELRDEDEKA